MGSLRLLSIVRRVGAVVALTLIYLVAGITSKLRYLRPGRPRRSVIMLIGTFHNPNWISAHVEPIAAAGIGRVLLVTDEPISQIEGVRSVCSPRWLQRSVSRAGAKFLWSIYVAIRYRPSICIGYHVFPAGVVALVAAAICGARSSFQVTSGQLELEGGGWHAENRLLAALQRPSKLVERAVLFMVRQFDLIVVRGSKARSYLREHGFTGKLEEITGSVTYPSSSLTFDQRKIDVLFVGRLTEYKRPDRFVEIIHRVVVLGAAPKVVLIGDGPDGGGIREMIVRYGLEGCIDLAGRRSDVEVFQRQAKVLVLTSRWEGVSIAMLEAMAAGTVPVVSNVGDLGDFVQAGSGVLVDEDDLDGFARAIRLLMSDAAIWDGFSSRARTTIEGRSTRAAVICRWRRVLGVLLGIPEGQARATE
jgi:glycosyltransferase involved in cell wall biosynthesis